MRLTSKKLGSTSDALAPEGIVGGGDLNAQLLGFKQQRAGGKPTKQNECGTA
jgi:hypothetical protein